MKEFLENYRKSLDAQGRILVSARESLPSCTQELTSAIRCMFVAKAWTGNMCSYYGGTSPYANDGKRQTVKDIEDADAKTYPLGVEVGDGVKFIDDTKQGIAELIAEFTDQYTAVKVTPLQKVCFNNIYSNLVEARFMLGFALRAIKDTKSTIYL